MSDRRINKFKNALQRDEELKLAMIYCKEGQRDKKKIPVNLRKYHKFQYDLYLLDDLLFLINKIIFPKLLKAKMLA